MEYPRKIIIVSGALGGIGRAICRKFALENWRVIALYKNTPREKAESFVSSLGIGHKAFCCDILDMNALSETFNQIDQEFSSVDSCVHAAISPIVRKGILTMTEQEFCRQFEVSVFGGFNLFKKVIPKMQKGSIIGMSSEAVHDSSHGNMLGYVSAKYALEGLLAELSRELGPNIKTHIVRSGFVDTPLHADIPEKVKQFLKDKGQSQDVESIAETVYQYAV